MTNIIHEIGRLAYDTIWIRTLKVHRSRLRWREARKHTQFLKRCQSAAQEPEIGAEELHLASTYREQGIIGFSTESTRRLAASMLEKVRKEEAGAEPIWDADGRYTQGDIYQRFPEIREFLTDSVSDVIRGIFGAEFKIYYGIMYRSQHDPDGAAGSQLWHADGGPGTCINLMFCLTETTPENGAMETLPWPETIEVCRGYRSKSREIAHSLRKSGAQSRQTEQRALLADYFDNQIETRFKDRIVQPTGGPGMVLAFRNNCVHRGGFPKTGRERIVCVFHVYPSDTPTPFGHYEKVGIAKLGPYPKNPAFGVGEA